MTVEQGQALADVTDAMVSAAREAGAGVASEARAQGQEVQPAIPPTSDLQAEASVVVALLAVDMATSAAREAVRISGPTTPAQDVADGVRKHLESLTDAQPRLYLGGALTDAQRAGRVATFRGAGTQPSFYASEVLDTNTCVYCRKVHGRFLGNSVDDPGVNLYYPRGGYVDCQGRSRCRGQIVGVWRPRYEP
jgi:hypothetical protein